MGDEDDDTRVSELRVGEAELLVLSFPLGGRRDLLATLTPSEQAVVALALQGMSNAEIAAARGAAERTIANQIASLYHKLGVSSRGELVALLTPSSAREDGS